MRSNGMLRPLWPFFVFVACSWCLEIDKSKRDTTRDHPGPISQKYHPLPWPNHTSLKSPFQDCSEKVQYTPPPEHHAPSNQPTMHGTPKQGSRTLRGPAESPQTSHSPGRISQKYGPLPPLNPYGTRGTGTSGTIRWASCAMTLLDRHAKGAGARGAIHWTPRVCDVVTKMTVDVHAEGMGTNGAIRWAPCGCDNAD